VPGVMDGRAFTEHVRNTSQELQSRRPGFCDFFLAAGFKGGHLSAFAEDYGRRPMDECDGWTVRSSKSEGGCFGGFRRRKEGYHGCKPVEAS